MEIPMSSHTTAARRHLVMASAIAAATLASACSDTTSPSAPARAIAPSSARPAVAVGVNTIVFQRQETGDLSNIYTMNDDGTNVTNLGTGAQPAWSPDHSKIAFVANNTIFIMNADGSGKKQLGVASDRFPSFTADGTRVVFIHATLKDSDVFTVNVDGTDRQLLLRMGGAAVEAPRISPDGTKLAIQATRRTDSDIIVVDLATGRRTVVADSATRETVPAWSPDSKRLAYLTGIRNKGLCIAVVNADGTGRKAFTNDVGFCSTVSWSPDGKELAFDSDTEGTTGIYRAPVDVPGTPVRLTTPPAKSLDDRLSWTR